MLRLDNTVNKHMIAGPCALESRDQLKSIIQILKGLGVRIVRSCLWKPRTRPGWDGMGEGGIDVLLEECFAEDMIPATEILTAEHAKAMVDGVMRVKPDGHVLVWIGSRNQNHSEQRKIGRILSEGPPNIHLMFKNQMWEDMGHWIGIAEHILDGGFPKDRLMTCHRGFAPNKYTENPLRLRNIPDFEMAMRVKEMLGIPIFFDPSHVGGSPENVALMTEQSLAYDFDGYIVEVHASPEKALTDSKQQLSPSQFDQFLKNINYILTAT